MEAKTRSVTPRFRVPGLDGLRALAVIVVMLFHLTPGAVVGGYLGVDIFFVISGFLITSLLVREHADTGRIALSAFWARRARRLLPALIVLLLVCSSAAFLVGGDVLVRLAAQVVGALTFSSNWIFIAQGSDYFSSSTPELFRNLWSLAVEEQFYLVWPLLVVIVLIRMRPRWRLAVTLVLAAASALAMGLLTDPAEPTRGYFGTDTHAFGLALGASLAFLTQHWPTRPLEWPRAARMALAPVGPLAVAALIAIAILLPGEIELVYRGGLVVVGILSVFAIAALLVPGSVFGRLLEFAPIRWVGVRSYGLYLWHWPVFILLLAALPSWSTDPILVWVLGGVALVVTCAAAAASYRFVEQPIRRSGFRASWRSVRRRVHASRRAGFAVAAVSLAVVVAAGGTGFAVASDPGVGEIEALVHAGQEAIEAANSQATPAPTPGASGSPSDPAPAPAPKLVGGDQISAFGDSVMLAAASQLQSDFPGIAIDAQVSRSLSSAPALIQAAESAGQLRNVVIVALGTNGPITREPLEHIRQIIGPKRQLVVVNVQAPRSWTEGVNSTLSAFALSYRSVELANWHDAVQPSLALLNRDRVHFGPTGARIFSGAIRDALQRLAELPPLRDDVADESLPRPV
ncbi:MAG TPA: acyltransferase family protein [Pseudolysinimonas sp.]|nr:acyltransferase family protein [Pseudolysinimonas sp.]